ncbi:hypothetical protein DTW68_29080 [Vibrio harveyi]|uniref:Uncharacterized protein n=1 Tax=Vibrio harveyi TaxID=669 RepID=A0A8B3DIZ3_VIBHA|nr:hypothetical protein DTW68_29080 [Vibrio harveyi]RIW13450.1 hypothetical protein DS957_010810 [Vibrio harveyi]
MRYTLAKSLKRKVHYIARYYIVFYVVYFLRIESVLKVVLRLDSIRKAAVLPYVNGFFVPEI